MANDKIGRRMPLLGTKRYVFVFTDGLRFSTKGDDRVLQFTELKSSCSAGRGGYSIINPAGEKGR